MCEEDINIISDINCNDITSKKSKTFSEGNDIDTEYTSPCESTQTESELITDTPTTPVYQKRQIWLTITIIAAIAAIGSIIYSATTVSGLKKEIQLLKDGTSVSVNSVVDSFNKSNNEPTTKPVDNIAEARKLIESGNYLEALKLLEEMTETEEVAFLKQSCTDALLAEYNEKTILSGDDMSDWFFIRHKDSLYNDDKDSLAGYIYQSTSDSANLLFQINIAYIREYNEGWVFPSKIKIKGEAGELNFSISRYIQTNGEILFDSFLFEETPITLNDEQITTLKTILTQSETIKVRLTSNDSQKDMVFSQLQIDDMLFMIEYYELLKEIYG